MPSHILSAKAVAGDMALSCLSLWLGAKFQDSKALWGSSPAVSIQRFKNIHLYQAVVVRQH